MRVVDLFCGCGGFSKGFEKAGFSIVAGVDNWKDALQTYKFNFPCSKVIDADLSTPEGIAKTYAQLSMEEIDGIIGGPPCQGFSVSGKRLIEDPRNILYKSFVEAVSLIRPKFFVMENVPGLVRLFGGKVKDQIIDDFSNRGFSVRVAMLSSEEFGVPQIRKRVFFVGINEKLALDVTKKVFPERTHGSEEQPFVSAKDAISDLDFLPDDAPLSDKLDYLIPPESRFQIEMRANSKYIFNHVITVHNPKTKMIISLVPDGGNYKDLPEELQQTRKVNIAWTRMNSTKPCFTIDTGHNHHFHYRANRVPTVRESARIQSFPDTFIFLGIKTSQLRQVGNAVPPLLGEKLAKKIFEVLKEK